MSRKVKSIIGFTFYKSITVSLSQQQFVSRVFTSSLCDVHVDV